MKSFLTIISNKVRFYLKHFWNNSRFIIMHLNLFHGISKIRYNKLGFNTFFSQVGFILRKKLVKK